MTEPRHTIDSEAVFSDVALVPAKVCAREVGNDIGLGVFATAAIARGEVVEVCQAILFPGALDDSVLHDHRLAWNDDYDCVGTGCAMLYNHSDTPNCLMRRVMYESAWGTNVLVVIALADIAPGDELRITYKCWPWW